MITGLDRVKRARLQLMQLHPFYGSLAMHLEMVEATVPTMATDGERLFVNPEFADKLTDAEIRGVVAHEVMHCAYAHFARQGERDGDTWNQATDYAINRDLLGDGHVLPACRLFDRRFADMSAEQIYAELARDPNRPKPNPASNFGAVQKPSKGNGTGAGDAGRVAEKWAIRATVAANAAMRAGRLPASAARMVSEIKTAKVDWRAVLRQFVTDTNRRDYSWSRPNRRFIGGGLYLPALMPDGTGHIVVAVDTSGSVDRATLAAFRAEVQAMLDDGAIDRATVVYCDAAINGTQEFEAGDQVTMKAVGGGGTRFSPVMDWCRANAPDAACLVYLTDLVSHDHGEEPGIPVMWCKYGRYPGKPPFGTVIEVDPHT